MTICPICAAPILAKDICCPVCEYDVIPTMHRGIYIIGLFATFSSVLQVAITNSIPYFPLTILAFALLIIVAFAVRIRTRRKECRSVRRMRNYLDSTGTTPHPVRIWQYEQRAFCLTSPFDQYPLPHNLSKPDGVAFWYSTLIAASQKLTTRYPDCQISVLQLTRAYERYQRTQHHQTNPAKSQFSQESLTISPH